MSLLSSGGKQLLMQALTILAGLVVTVVPLVYLYKWLRSKL